jgi:ketosteroid isomerase-like protein
MSQENVERIRRGYEAFNRGDFADAARDFDANFEWRIPFQLPDSPPDETYRGPEEVIRFWQTWAAYFDDFRMELEEIIDLGDKVIVIGGLRGRGAESGVEVTTPSFPQLWTFGDDGRPLRVEMFQSRDEAFEAARLSD